MGLLSTLGWGGGGGGLLDSLVKLKQLDKSDAMETYRTALLGKLMRQEQEGQRAAGIISSVPTEKQVGVQVLPEDPTGTMEGGGYAPPPVQRTLSTPMEPYEVNRLRANALMDAGLSSHALQYQKTADAERKDIVSKLVDKAWSNIENMRTNGVPEQVIQRAYDTYSRHPLVGSYFPAGMEQGAKREKETKTGVGLNNYLVTVAGKLGLDPTDPESIKKATVAYSQSPELQRGFVTYTQSLAPPMFNFQQTAEGIIPGNARTGVMGAPTGHNKPMTNEMITQEQQIGTLKDVYDRMKQLYHPDPTKPANTDWVGPVAGRTSGIREKIGIGPLSISPMQTQFNAQIAQMQNTLVYLLSGKQINPEEFKRLEKQLPDKNLPPANFEARNAEFERTLNSIIANRQKNMGGYGLSAGQRATTAPTNDNKRLPNESIDDFLKRTGQK